VAAQRGEPTAPSGCVAQAVRDLPTGSVPCRHATDYVGHPSATVSEDSAPISRGSVWAASSVEF